MTYPVLISTTSFQVVTADELRDYLRGDDGDSDDVLNFYIKTATEYLEIAAKRSIIRKRYLVEFEHCTKLSVRLPMGHVDSLVIIEADGTLQNINYYSLKGDTLILPNYHATLKVTYDVGFADSASVPHIYKMAILACSSDLFIHRFTTNDATPITHNNMAQHYGALLRSYDL
jgi:hypothetical protein